MIGRRTRFALAALVLPVALVAAGCTASDDPAPTPSVTQSETAAPVDNRVDPHTITGPSTAQPIPEITPVTDDPDPQLPTTAIGADGVTVEITDVSRVLALDLYGTLTETVIGLGLGDALVGRSISNQQAVVQDLPVVTQNGHELNAEAILALHPTFVIMDTTMGPPEIPQQLRDSGVPVLVVSSERGVDLIVEQIEIVAAAFGVEAEGELLVEQFETELEAANDHIAALTEGFEPLTMSFMYVRGTGSVFFIMGEGSGGDDLIEHIGGIDAASAAGVADIAPATAESVLTLNPELIITMTGGLESTGGIDGFLARPGVADTIAGQHARIVDMADGQVLSFGPSFPAVLVSLANAVYTP